MIDAERGYLLVYHARPELDGESLLDRTNDPELREAELTWGICRTNVRGWVHRGWHLFFVAYAPQLPLERQYQLVVHARVGELLSAAQAHMRFPGRQNVILDVLPPGMTIQAQVAEYLAEHREHLKWAGANVLLRRASSEDISAAVTARVDGGTYVHSYWDGHEDWRRRLEKPYVVADPNGTHRLRRPLPYSELTQLISELPRSLRIANRQTPHPPRRVSGDTLERLLLLAEGLS